MLIADVRTRPVHHQRLTPAWLDQVCRDALERESDAWPKPGLVTPVDPGSHRDMNHATFVRSIASLHGYFAEIAAAAADPIAPPLSVLQAIGIRAEARMLAATGGKNTHRGAIFNLGLLSAACAYRQHAPALHYLTCGAVVAQTWGMAILNGPCDKALSSHGERMRQRYGSGGARQEAAAGFPSVYSIGLPTLRALLSRGTDQESALIGALLALMAEVDDTNLLWRGGLSGLRDVQAAATAFNRAGGVMQADWREQLLDMHAWMVRRNLSPGGSADLVAATWLAYRLEAQDTRQ